MFVSDLSPMPSLRHSYTTKAIAVGWLDCLHQFTKGVNCKCFCDKLHKLCLNPVRLTSSTVSVRSVAQTVEAASACVFASGRAELPRCGVNVDSWCGERTRGHDSSGGGSAAGPADRRSEVPSTPGSIFFPRLVSRVRNQVPSNARV